MKSIVNTCIFAIAFTAITCVGNVNDVEAGNGWGWAKPLNQKPGSMFYTSNRKARGGTTSRYTTSRRFSSSQTYAQPESIAPSLRPHVTVQSPAVMVDATPTTQVPVKPVLGSVVTPAETQLVKPPAKAPSMLDGWLVP